MTIKIDTTQKDRPAGKLADAEIHFEPPNLAAIDRGLEMLRASDEEAVRAIAAIRDVAALLAGLKLIGFGVWQQRTGTARNVTFPARQYSVNGERRSFALLRPAGGDDLSSSARVREAVLHAYAEHERETE